MRTRIAPVRVGVLAALALALPLAGCTQSAAVPSTAPSTPQPTASVTSEPGIEPSASATAPAPAGAAWQTRDGAMRLQLPEGWSVDDRSAMGEASEMVNRGPGWLNDVMVLDAQGDRMLWYREHYGTDFVDCREVQAHSLEIGIEPFSPELVDELERQGAPVPQLLILAETAEASTWAADATPGAWAVAMGVSAQMPTSPGDGCSALTDVLYLGNRVAELDVVADDVDAAGEADTTIGFADEQAARAWLEGDEAALLVEVLSSIELTGAPMLDEAP